MYLILGLVCTKSLAILVKNNFIPLTLCGRVASGGQSHCLSISKDEAIMPA